MDERQHVFLVGFMGAGKSTVGRIVAEKLSRPFIDCDRRIEVAAGSTISEIFACEGEEAFRDMESAFIEGLRSTPAAVVACGGGVVLRESNRRTLREIGRVVYLVVTPEEAAGRIGDPESRPLLSDVSGSGMASLLDKRRSLYEEVADISVDTLASAPSQVADSVIASLDVGS